LELEGSVQVNVTITLKTRDCTTTPEEKHSHEVALSKERRTQPSIQKKQLQESIMSARLLDAEIREMVLEILIGITEHLRPYEIIKMIQDIFGKTLSKQNLNRVLYRMVEDGNVSKKTMIGGSKPCYMLSTL
jgi:hypothetical protein